MKMTNQEKMQLLKWVLNKGLALKTRLEKENPKLLENLKKAFYPAEIKEVFYDEC